MLDRRLGQEPEGGALEPPAHRRSTVLALLAGVGLVVLSLLVATDRTVGLDDRARQLFRPNDEWGDLQVQVDLVVEGLRPWVTAPLLAGAAVLVAFWRRSWWPLVCVTLAGAAGVSLTLALKLLLRRPDTHGEVGAFAGSYPSGHVMTLLVATGCLVLLLEERPGPVSWSLVALVGAVMGWALLVQTAHWLTDVLGGALIGAVVLAAATRLPFTGAAASSPNGPRARVRPRLPTPR